MFKFVILICGAFSAFASENTLESDYTDLASALLNKLLPTPSFRPPPLDANALVSTILDDAKAPSFEEKTSDASPLGSALLNDIPPTPYFGPQPSGAGALASDLLSKMPELSLRIPPLRRQTREISSEDIDYIVNNGSLKNRLITMVRYVDTDYITEEHIINLINANPGCSNPYSDSFQAHLIALACREGRINIVSAILENNPEALNCSNSGYSPLDEAMAFGQMDLAKFLIGKGARKMHVAELHKYNTEIFSITVENADEAKKTEIMTDTKGIK